MSIDADYLALRDAVAPVLPRLEIVGLYLPQIATDLEFRDEFGFVFLSDGSIGPFYVSLEPVLKTLWGRYAQPESVCLDPLSTAKKLYRGDLPDRALAIGVFNALSRTLMRGAGYEPPDRGSDKEHVATDSCGPVGLWAWWGIPVQ